MQIDRENGAIRLPNGLEIGPALTQDAFRVLPAASNARSQDYGTLPWIHYHLSGGQIDGKELRVSLCFYDQLLVFVSVSADLYPPGPKDWSNYSLEVEAATKQFHDRLLERMLGKPSKGHSFLFGRLPNLKETLERPLRWDFVWGSVFSSHYSKGGGTDITVRYGNRLEEANKSYQRRAASGITSRWNGPYQQRLYTWIVGYGLREIIFTASCLVDHSGFAQIRHVVDLIPGMIESIRPAEAVA